MVRKHLALGLTSLESFTSRRHYMSSRYWMENKMFRVRRLAPHVRVRVR